MQGPCVATACPQSFCQSATRYKSQPEEPPCVQATDDAVKAIASFLRQSAEVLSLIHI